MSPLLQPLHLLPMMFAGWVNRHQLDAIDYLQEENRVLKERLGGRRIRFTDAERRRLARKAHALGRKVLSELEKTLVAPDTLLRWHRELVASKWNYTSRRGPGRPRIMKAIVDLILRMALENPAWGYTRICGALGNLGHQVGRGTIANILHEHGIEPAPERDRHTRWSTFLKAHWECLTATDFLSVEVHTLRGLVTHPVLHRHLFPIGAHRRHHAAPRQSLDDADRAESHRHRRRFPSRHAISDSRPRYKILSRVPQRARPRGRPPHPPSAAIPELNAFAERFVRSIKSECLNRMIFFGQDSLQHAIGQFMAHYHAERNHQGLENRLLRPAPLITLSRPVHRRQRLGGMLDYYHRAAA